MTAPHSESSDKSSGTGSGFGQGARWEGDDPELLAAVVDPADGKGLREMADKLRDKLGSGVVAIGCPFQGKVNLLVAVTKDLTDKLHAGKLVGAMAEEVGGKGGGRPDLAQAGGSQPEKLPAALSLASTLVGKALRD